MDDRRPRADRSGTKQNDAGRNDAGRNGTRRNDTGRNDTGRNGTGRNGTDRNETPLERADRNFAELLQELRVTQTGVQILFAFLLTLAFTPRFRSLDTVQRATYVTTLLLAVLAAALFTAPAALHRSLFQRNAKPLIVRVSSRLATIGLGVLMLAFTGSVLLVVDVALGRGAGIAAGAGTLALCLGLWRVLPWLVRHR